MKIYRLYRLEYFIDDRDRLHMDKEVLFDMFMAAPTIEDLEAKMKTMRHGKYIILPVYVYD